MVDNKQAFNAALWQHVANTQYSVLEEVRLLVVHCGVTDSSTVYAGRHLLFAKAPISALAEVFHVARDANTGHLGPCACHRFMEIVVFTSMIVGGISNSNLIVSERALLSFHAHEHEIPFSKKENLVTMRSSPDNMPGDALAIFLCYKAQAHIRRRQDSFWFPLSWS